MEKEERQRKLEAARAKLAHFRQRKAKSDSSHPQKKTAKRKSPAVHPNDLPPQECTLDTAEAELCGSAESSTSAEHLDITLGMEEEELNASMERAHLEVQVCQQRILDLEERLKGKQTAIDDLTNEVEELRQQLAQVNSQQLQQELETAVQNRNDIIAQLTSNLQQTIGHRDEIQQEAQELTNQIQALQHQLQEANKLLRAKSLGSAELVHAQEQISAFQRSLKEQSQHLETLQQQARDLEQQLEYSQQSNKDKENLILQMEGKLRETENTVKQLSQVKDQKEVLTKELKDKLDVQNQSIAQLQNSLSLRDKELMDAKVSIQETEQKFAEKLKQQHEKDVYWQLQQLRADLEEAYGQQILRIKQELHEETKGEIDKLNANYKAELESLKSECLNSGDSDIQSLNIKILELNEKLRESETVRRELLRNLKLQVEELNKEKSKTSKYKDLVEDLKQQLSLAEEQAAQVQDYKAEKEHLNEEIQWLNSVVQELSSKLVVEIEASQELKLKLDAEVSNYTTKLNMVEQEKVEILSQLAEAQKTCTELFFSHQEEMCQLHSDLETQHGLKVDSVKHGLEDLKESLSKLKAKNNHRDNEKDNEVTEDIHEFELDQGEDNFMDKYLITTKFQEESFAGDNIEGLIDSEPSIFELDSKIVLEQEMESLMDDHEKDPMVSSVFTDQFEFEESSTEPKSETVTSTIVQLLGGGISQDGNATVTNREKEDLMQKCSLLIQELNEKEIELKKSSEETQVALKKWKKLTEELSALHLELEKERLERANLEQKLEHELEEKRTLENKIHTLEEESGGENVGNVLGDTAAKGLAFPLMQEVVKELEQEKELLQMQLQDQEQLVKDLQEQKLAADSVTSEVQSLFGRQLATLQSQRDQLQEQLNVQKAKNHTISELLGQKAVLEESQQKELVMLKSQIDDEKELLKQVRKEKSNLEEKLLSLEQMFTRAEAALKQANGDKEDLEKNLTELNKKAKDLEEASQSERLEFDNQLKSKNSELQKLEVEMEMRESQFSEKETALQADLAKSQLEREALLNEEAEKLAKAVEQAQANVGRQYEEEISKMKQQHLSQVKDLKMLHQKKVEKLNTEMVQKVQQLEEKLEEERRTQIGFVKQVHEREHDREMAELIAQHQVEMRELRAELSREQQQLFDDLRERMSAAHQMELQLARSQYQEDHSLELEAVRLSLTNMHTAQLELTQSNLQREKEAALRELRGTLNDKRAQELAVLQSRHQFELEHLKEESRLVAQRHAQEMDEAKRKFEVELADVKTKLAEEHAQKMESLKQEWADESHNHVGRLQQELSEKHRVEVEELQERRRTECERLEDQLEAFHLEKEQIKLLHENQENLHQSAMAMLREQLEREHGVELEQLRQQNKEKEEAFQNQLENLKAAYKDVKTHSDQEIENLWSQLESTRTSRQELNELKEQLLVRTSHVEDIERLKQDFEQQRQQLGRKHEEELEQLRAYFEQKLRDSEAGYREDVALLHQRLSEQVREAEAANLSCSSSMMFPEDKAEEESGKLFEELTQRLEQHKEELDCLRLQLEEKHRQELETLSSSLSFQHRESLLQMKLDLSDRYFSEIQEMKNKHSLELEQLRAKLSEQHIKEITKLRLKCAQESARQVEAEVAERVRALEEEHSARVAHLASEKERITELETRIGELRAEHTDAVQKMTEEHECHVTQEVEKLKTQLVEEFTNKAREAAELHKKEEEEWKSRQIELLEQAEREKQNLKEQLVQREEEARRFQEKQAARIVELEKEVKEERNRLQQLEDSLENEQCPQVVLIRERIRTQCDQELATAKALMADELQKLHSNLQEQSKLRLQEAEDRFAEEHKQMTERFTTEQEAALKELKERHDEELVSQNQQHQEDLQAFEAQLQEKYQTEIEVLKTQLHEQHKATEAELQVNHQAELDELEAKHLSNLDTLESTFVSEIQSIRDEHARALLDLTNSFTVKIQEKEKEAAEVFQEKQKEVLGLKEELEKMKAQHQNHLKLAQDKLRKELANIHLEKFKAMSYELEEAHKSEKSVLEEEKQKVLEALHGEVVGMEEQHQKALQELQDLHTAELHAHKETFSRQLQEEMEKIRAQHQQELQGCASTSAQEAEELRKLLAQLEMERAQQQLQFQEEIELLKCQSEVLLDQQISQLKEEFESEKTATLQVQEKEFAQQRERTLELHQNEKEQLMTQVQEKVELITQLEEEAKSLRNEAEKKSSELETLLQRRDRENQEGGNLVAMLKSDLVNAKQERVTLQESHERLLKLLSEVLKANIATEDTINKRIGICLDSIRAKGGSGDHQNKKWMAGLPQHMEMRERGGSLCLDDTTADSNLWSVVTDEGLELSQQLCDSIFLGPQLESRSETIILEACQRLHSAVEKMLELVTESARQLEQTHGFHAHLEEQFSRRNEETSHLVTQHQELGEQLNKEMEAKSHLALELHKAEGIIEGYVAEKAALEDVLHQKEDSEHRLVLELETLQEQLHNLTQERDLLIRQRELLTADASKVERGVPAVFATDKDSGLIEETDKLAKEKVELQCQADKDCSDLQAQLKLLENELEEQISRALQLEEYRMKVTDQQHQIQALEKQLKNQRQFMNEQAMEREHERDEFQQEIQKLEAQLKLPGKSQVVEGQSGRKVESLQASIREKTDHYNELLLAREQQERHIAEQNKVIEKLEAQIKELEHAALTSAEAAKRLEQELQRVKRKEQELQRVKRKEQELIQDKEALHQQNYNNLMQISALQSKLDEARHRVPVDATSDQTVREQLQAEREALISKEKENESLAEQLEQFREDLLNKNEEVLQLNMQLEIQTKQNDIRTNQLQEEIIRLKEEVAGLCSRLGQDPDGTRAAVLELPQALLNEKNQEIDHLNEQIVRLQHELESLVDNKLLEEKNAEIEELKRQVEHLQGDQERHRKDKEEEVEQLHEVIEKLQQELAQLGPNRHEVSDSQDSRDSLSPLEMESAGSLHEELKRSSMALQHLGERKLVPDSLEELKQELKMACTERETLQQVLEEEKAHFKLEVEMWEQSLQEAQDLASQHLQELTSLQQQHEKLVADYSLLRANLCQRDADMELLSSQLQELKDALMQKEEELLEKEIQIQTMEEERMAEVADLELLPEQVAELEAKLAQKDAQLKVETEELCSLRAEGSQLDLKFQALSSKEEGYHCEIEKLQADAAKLEAHIQEHSDDLQMLRHERDELEALRQKGTEADREVVRLQALMAERESQIQTLKEALEQLEKCKTLDSEISKSQKNEVTLMQDQLITAEASLQQIEASLCKKQELVSQLTLELAKVKEDLSSSAEQIDKLLEEGQEKDRVIADLEIHNRNLKIQVNQLQEAFLKQQQDVASQGKELEELRMDRCGQSLELQQLQVELGSPLRYTEQPVGSTHTQSKPRSFVSSLMGESSLSLPEAVRNYDASLESSNILHSRISEITGLHSTDMDTMQNASPALQRESDGAVEFPSMYSDDCYYYKDHPSAVSPPLSESVYSIAGSIDTEKGSDIKDLHVTGSVCQEDAASMASAPEWASDGYGSNMSSDLGVRLNTELETTERLDANFVEYLCQRGIVLIDNKGSVEEHRLISQELLSPELQNLLRKVHEEGCKVLALSERSFQHPMGQPGVIQESWQQERQTLLNTIESLKELISKTSDQPHKDSSGGMPDWRAELLQAVQSVFEKERDFLHSELHAHLQSQERADDEALAERLEKVVQEQAKRQCSALEQLLNADRKSLQAEVQELRTQLQIAHLQSQEKLQQLQDTLTSAEEEGTKREHQLRRQAELLEYKLQQEQAIARDLQNSLSAELGRSAELREHLKNERAAVDELKSELAEEQLELERLVDSQQQLQKEVDRLSSVLEHKENDLLEVLQCLESERQKGNEMNSILEQQQLENSQREDQTMLTLQEVQATLEEERAQKNRLHLALEQEQVSSSNLRKELQIEQSRCEALILQERSKLSVAQQLLKVEKARTAELSSALQHEQTQSEQLNVRLNQESVRRDKDASEEQNFVQKLQTQLEEERSCAEELAAMIEKTQQHNILSKRQQEAETQLFQREAQREKEVSSKLRATLESLQAQKQELIHSLEAERQLRTELQEEHHQLQMSILALKEQQRSWEEQREKERRQEQQAFTERDRERKRDWEKLHEFDLQHQRDQQRIKQLQQTLADLEERERHLTSQRLQPGDTSCPRKLDHQSTGTPSSRKETSPLHQQQLERIRQQLQLAAIQLRGILQTARDRRSTEGQNQSEDEDLLFLLHTLTELNSDLKRLSFSTEVKDKSMGCRTSLQTPVQSLAALVDRLLKENADLISFMTALTEEKMKLRRAVQKLERDLQYQQCRKPAKQEDVDSIQAAEKAAWQRERSLLQNALKQAEGELSRVTAEIENRPLVDGSNSKIQRLYRRYLRAESFRKALVYQKKYLLLLLGGFQACEEATLSLIARMGVFPSSVECSVPCSRPLTKFRSAVRVVIAISRLKFLVKKWQKSSRKGQPSEGTANGIGHHPGTRPEVLRQQQHLSALNSPPTRDVGQCTKASTFSVVNQLPKLSYQLHSSPPQDRISSSTHDPECSLTEFIHHLEGIQHRLGGLQTGFSRTSLPQEYGKNRTFS
ncbi:pericentrin isoform X2 [Latimeria chalumnae]|uniref:pericentrin isoform X2 n=1 Tax=Latimeria chalumnae TaxID=7897 RepID=UPI00313B3F5F